MRRLLSARWLLCPEKADYENIVASVRVINFDATVYPQYILHRRLIHYSLHIKLRPASFLFAAGHCTRKKFDASVSRLSHVHLLDTISMYSY